MDNIVFQPYGKDKFYLNLVATKEGEWLFGPSDIEAFDNIKKQSTVHSYILVDGKNPKYHKIYIDDDFEVKKDSKILTKRDNKKPDRVNELYIFLIYNYLNSFLHMDYTYSYDELLELKKEFNILSTFVIIGDHLHVEKEKLGVGIGTHKENILDMIDELKNEKRTLEDL